MTGRKAVLLVLAMGSWGAMAWAAEGDAWQQVLQRDFGTGDDAMAAIRTEVQSASPADRPAIEAKLIAVVQSGEATAPAKQFACRMLRLIGTARCVPAVAALLTDERLSHSGRYVLRGIAADEAAQALRDALGRTGGKLRIGIVETIGERRDAKALTALAGLLDSGDEATVEAALKAIGKIGSSQAADVLERAKVTGRAQMLWCDAALACAEGLARAGDADRAERMCRAIFEGAFPVNARAAAFGWMIQTRKERAMPLVMLALKSGDRKLAQAAGAAMIDIPGPDATKAFARELPALPPAGKVVVLNALAARGGAGSSEAVGRLVSDPDASVRMAAITALGSVGEADSVDVLAGALTAGGSTAPAAMQALEQMKAQGVVEAMLRLASSGAPAARARMLEVLARRGAAEAVPLAFQAAGEADGGVRGAAIAALGALAGPEDLPKMVAMLQAGKDGSDRGSLARAIAQAAGRQGDRERRVRPVIEAMAKADADAEVHLLGVLHDLGGEAALAAVRGALGEAAPDVKLAAVRALGEWRDAAPMADLLKLAKTDDQPTHRILALRGYIRMIGLSKGTIDERLGMCKEAMAAATRAEERRMGLSALGQVPALEALKLAEKALDDPAVRNEAFVAYSQIAQSIAGGYPDEAKAALKRVAASAGDQRVRDGAKIALSRIDRSGSSITAWLVSGPYREQGKDDGALFDIAFAPEKGDGQDAKWNVAPADNDGKVDLGEILGGENRVAYLRTVVICPAARKARLLLGSDDGVKVWLNGKLVHANKVNRGYTADEDTADIELKQGDNALLFKVTNGGDGWVLGARVCNSDGSKMENVKYRGR